MATAEKNIKKTSLKIITASVLFLVCLFVFSLLMMVVVMNETDRFDQAVFSYLEQHMSPALANTMQAITFFGDTMFLLPAYCLMAGFLILKKKHRWATDITIVALSGELMKHFLKTSFARARPDQPVFDTLQSFSFPSGHALSSFILAASIIYLLWKGNIQDKWRWTFTILLLLYSFLVGFSRVFLRYHYASDVIAGFAFGYIWVMICLLLLGRFHNSGNSRITE